MIPKPKQKRIKNPSKSGRPPKSTRKLKNSKPNKKSLLSMHHDMLLIRRFEEKAGQLYGMGKIGGFCHLYIGQEAVVVGLQSVNEEQDSIITSYRDHGHMLACGMEPAGVMSELTGRAVGYSKGKGGSMHMFSREKNFYGGHGIVGAQVPIGAGLGFAHKYKNDGGVAMTYLGDGAANQGQVYETFNMAALWKLPVIFIIENNQYAMGTSTPRSTAGTDLYERGAAYGIVGKQVDGMDVLAVREAGIKAIDYARCGKGPYILEMKTYRYRGHSMSDPAKYRTREEVDAMRKQHDPIDHLRDVLLREGIEEAELKQQDTEVKKIISDATDVALGAPEPTPNELFTDVLIEVIE